MKLKQKKLPKEELTPEGKIWMVLKIIDETISISPNGKEFSIDIKKLENYLIASDCEKIFEKLEKDYNAIKIIKKPSVFDLDIDNARAYIIKIPSQDSFNEALNNAHIKHFSSMEMLTGDNLFSVVDVSADIMNQLQMALGNKVSIPIIPPIIRFSTLMPAKSVNLIHRYWDFRWKALKYLKNNEAIESFELLRDEINHYESIVKVKLDRIKFTKFYERLMIVYKKRVRFSSKEEEKKAEETIPQPPTQKIEIIEMPELKIKGFEEKVVLQKPKKKKIQLRNFPAGLKWEEVSIRFLNEHEVIIKARNETLQATYDTMGFQDEKKKLPNKQWQFLQLLALKNGEVSWENNQNLPLKQINSIKKQKQLLTEALKAYFQIYDSEPFHDYKTEKAYRIKITFTPEPELKDVDEREV